MATLESLQNYSEGIGLQEEAATLSTPESGYRKLYAKSDGIYELDDSGVEKKLANITDITTNSISEISDDTTPTLGGDLTVGDNLVLYNTTLTVDDTASGKAATVTVDTNSVGVGAVLFMATDGNYDMANATDDTKHTFPVIALETGTGSKKVLLEGYIRSDGWDWTTIGGPIYISTTDGTLTQTAPSGSGNIVKIMGYAKDADTMYFNPSKEWIEV